MPTKRLNIIEKGEKVLCIKTVTMKPSCEIAYRQGEIYTSERTGCITDRQGRKDHMWTGEPEFNRYFVFIEGTCLYDTYGEKLRVGQKVAVVASAHIVRKGKITEINQDSNQVTAELTWPIGVTTSQIFTSYSRRDFGQVCMDEIMVLDDD